MSFYFGIELCFLGLGVRQCLVQTMKPLHTPLHRSQLPVLYSSITPIFHNKQKGLFFMASSGLSGLSSVSSSRTPRKLRPSNMPAFSPPTSRTPSNRRQPVKPMPIGSGVTTSPAKKLRKPTGGVAGGVIGAAAKVAGKKVSRAVAKRKVQNRLGIHPK